MGRAKSFLRCLADLGVSGCGEGAAEDVEGTEAVVQGSAGSSGVGLAAARSGVAIFERTGTERGWKLTFTGVNKYESRKAAAMELGRPNK